MAILWEDNLVGTPSSGTPNTTNHPWAANFGGAVAYTAATVAGLRALAFGPSFGAAYVAAAGTVTRRLRFYAQWSGTQSGHHFLAGMYDAGNSPHADAQIRNVAGPPVWNRWNFSSAGATGAWAANTPWRFEYRYETGVGCLLEVWTNPASTGAPDYAITAPATTSPTITQMLFGNTNGSTGLVVLMGALAMSDGPRIGPYVPPTPSAGAAVRGVIVGGDLVPAAVRGVIQSGDLVPAAIRGVTPL